jgi:hypothetical protein
MKLGRGHATSSPVKRTEGRGGAIPLLLNRYGQTINLCTAQRFSVSPLCKTRRRLDPTRYRSLMPSIHLPGQSAAYRYRYSLKAKALDSWLDRADAA